MAKNPKYQKLTAKQAKFVEEFFKDSSSARAAARRAGYAKGACASMGPNLLKHPIVSAELDELIQIRKHRLGLTEDRILQELAHIAFANMKDVLKEDELGNITIDLNSLTYEQAAALSEVQKGRTGTKVKLNDKLAALVHIGKHLGMFREKVEVTGKLSLEQLVMDSFKPTEMHSEAVKKKEEDPGTA